MIKREEVYKIGKIGKPHGVKGEVTLNFDDDVFDRVDCDYLVLEVDGILVPFFFDEYRFKGDATALFTFSGIDTKDKAQELTGCDVYFPFSLADNASGDMPLTAIGGFTLIDAEHDGAVIGTVTAVDDSTMNILLHVHTPSGNDIMVPAADEFIKDIDTKKRQITVQLPEGLLDLG